MDFSQWKEEYLKQDFSNRTMDQYSMALAAWEFQQKKIDKLTTALEFYGNNIESTEDIEMIGPSKLGYYYEIKGAIARKTLEEIHNV